MIAHRHLIDHAVPLPLLFQGRRDLVQAISLVNPSPGDSWLCLCIQQMWVAAVLTRIRRTFSDPTGPGVSREKI
jgi:hypothetical protein